MKILAIGSHYDDIELSCAGTLHKLMQLNNEVFYLGLSDIGSNELKTECQYATQELGIENVDLVQFSSRYFNLHRQSILDLLCEKRKQIQPDIVFTHGSLDAHQDHFIVHQESKRAFKGLTILGYNHPWNVTYSVKHLTVKINIEKKLQVLSHYKSQAHREYFNPEYIKAMNFNGEHFEVISLNENIFL